MDFLMRFAAALEPLWAAALPAPVGFGELTDTLPHKAERYVHRIRLVDAAGHISAGAAIAADRAGAVAALAGRPVSVHAAANG